MSNRYLDTKRQQLRFHKDKVPIAGISLADAAAGGYVQSLSQSLDS